ncbi:MAG: PCP reductase family protein, partial [Candidatus Dormibacteraeota bacterium]|nr:PCP reductase family protein [Candidatus Dormibacteraeota bacterium]
MDQSRCPFPHESGSCDAPQWSEDSRRRADEVARAKARYSRLDAERAASMARQAVESRAEDRAIDAIDADFVDQVGKKMGYGHPLSERTGTLEFEWTPEAEERLREVPEFCRELTRWRVEWTAHKKGLGYRITPEIMEVKYAMWGEVSDRIEAREGQQMPWTEEAEQRLERIPEFVRGQVIQAVEGNAR